MVLEEVAAMAATFLLLIVLVQVSAAMTARSAADAAVAAATRRASLPEADWHAESEKLAATVAALIPGATDITADILVGSSVAAGRVTFRWTPPGPVLTPVVITVDAEVPIAASP